MQLASTVLGLTTIWTLTSLQIVEKMAEVTRQINASLNEEYDTEPEHLHAM